MAVTASSAITSHANAAPFAYVTNFSSGTISLIDTATNTVTAKVTVGFLPYGVAITPDGAFAYVANYRAANVSDSGNVSVIDTATDAVTAKVTVGLNPLDVAITPSPTLDLGPGYFEDFDGGNTLGSGVSGELNGAGMPESVRDYAGLGNGGNTFGGLFLRNITGGYWGNGTTTGDPGYLTRLTLTGLPPHSGINLNFLFAKINTWDGSTQPDFPEAAPDIFEVKVDGAVVFAESLGFFDPSFTPSPPVLLADFVNLGFSDWDSAFDMDRVDALSDIPHRGDSAVIEWRALGDGWQGGDEDESWAIDNLEVRLTDHDSDFDTVRDAIDNCPTVPNSDQLNSDSRPAGEPGSGRGCARNAGRRQPGQGVRRAISHRPATGAELGTTPQACLISSPIRKKNTATSPSFTHSRSGLLISSVPSWMATAVSRIES